MTLELWSARWAQKQIGFHEGKPNDQLVACFGRLALAPGASVLVPLAGKAVDLRWLAAQGHRVVGVELVLEAIHAFFEEGGLDPRDHEHALGPHRAFTVDALTLVQADMFSVLPSELGTFDAVYDRAALIALEPQTREAYVQVCRSLCKPGAPTLLIGFEHGASVAGPPWAVDETEVRRLFAGRDLEVLDRRQGPVSPRLAAAGVASTTETAYRIG